jgi:hypothetical protein
MCEDRCRTRLDPARMPSNTVAKYVWAVLKVRALCRELDQALIGVEQTKTALMATHQADALWAEGRKLFSRSLRSRRYWTMLTADLEDFVRVHRPHGSLVADTGALTPNGYRLTIACQCGVTFERWITPEEAARDLVTLARLN